MNKNEKNKIAAALVGLVCNKPGMVEVDAERAVYTLTLKLYPLDDTLDAWLVLRCHVYDELVHYPATRWQPADDSYNCRKVEVERVEVADGPEGTEYTPSAEERAALAQYVCEWLEDDANADYRVDNDEVEDYYRG